MNRLVPNQSRIYIPYVSKTQKFTIMTTIVMMMRIRIGTTTRGRMWCASYSIREVFKWIKKKTRLTAVRRWRIENLDRRTTENFILWLTDWLVASRFPRSLSLSLLFFVDPTFWDRQTSSERSVKANFPENMKRERLSETDIQTLIHIAHSFIHSL